MALLTIKNLCIEFPSRLGVERAVDNVSLDLNPGRIIVFIPE
jgi:ABC-type antimicrobial peptide transport system ATPase subunit